MDREYLKHFLLNESLYILFDSLYAIVFPCCLRVAVVPLDNHLKGDPKLATSHLVASIHPQRSQHKAISVELQVLSREKFPRALCHRLWWFCLSQQKPPQTAGGSALADQTGEFAHRLKNALNCGTDPAELKLERKFAYNNAQYEVCVEAISQRRIFGGG